MHIFSHWPHRAHATPFARSGAKEIIRSGEKTITAAHSLLGFSRSSSSSSSSRRRRMNFDRKQIRDVVVQQVPLRSGLSSLDLWVRQADKKRILFQKKREGVETLITMYVRKQPIQQPRGFHLTQKVNFRWAFFVLAHRIMRKKYVRVCLLIWTTHNPNRRDNVHNTWKLRHSLIPNVDLFFAVVFASTRNHAWAKPRDPNGRRLKAQHRKGAICPRRVPWHHFKSLLVAKIYGEKFIAIGKA